MKAIIVFHRLWMKAVHGESRLAQQFLGRMLMTRVAQLPFIGANRVPVLIVDDQAGVKLFEATSTTSFT